MLLPCSETAHAITKHAIQIYFPSSGVVLAHKFFVDSCYKPKNVGNTNKDMIRILRCEKHQISKRN